MRPILSPKSSKNRWKMINKFLFELGFHPNQMDIYIWAMPRQCPSILWSPTRSVEHAICEWKTPIRLKRTTNMYNPFWRMSHGSNPRNNNKQHHGMKMYDKHPITSISSSSVP